MTIHVKNWFVLMLLLVAVSAQPYQNLSTISAIDNGLITMDQDQSEMPFEEQSEGEAPDSEQNSFDNEKFIGHPGILIFASSTSVQFIGSDRSLLQGVNRPPYSPPELILV